MEVAEDPFDRRHYLVLKQAVEALAGVCDGAAARDDQGFDGADTRAGHLYAFLPLDAWPLSAFHRAWCWTKKYHRQLGALQIDCSALPEPPLYTGEDRQIALHTDGTGFFVVFPHDDWRLVESFRTLSGTALHKEPIGAKGTLCFRYRTYHGAGNILLTWAEQHHFRLGSGVRACAQSNCRVVYEQESDSFALYFPDRVLNAEVKAIPCRSFSYTGGFHWIIAARRNAAGPLRAFLHRHDFVLSPEAEHRLQALE
ncbi:hypothetical protein KSF_107290 [Reticulibacter mediterranei]|uniref:Uncharacterized protein n=1 Tax=Reticulibacter mediterranei TaxID=2778369 RepID=A0A8J3J349_9CHLR|nr:hypothetical protein [Reticulibacter mediterranei]GHP00682.1 hypothetical protein KSF_107290 [Reticulibacter mediterranei]